MLYTRKLNVITNISVPLIVGGGIDTCKDVRDIYLAGADIVVVGNAIENNPDMIRELGEVSNILNMI